ncbi:putative xanthine dehydrogenase subunit A [Baekduia alba]|uniref:XdhC family protein n=1 Tax=Baekduia alba TaxID=2997333 RepID=UPI0023426F52|nr:XdhC/CoxI family protein [Baekduia alba]WCB96881.1 putative xanthine dehydrogenase subunit A [Baekduia alba]
MRDVLERLLTWSGRGEAVALATVVATRHSAPRPVGARLAVSERGELCGSVSGGCVEGAVVEATETILRDGRPRLLHFGIADEQAWEVGLPCGGEIDVWVERFAPMSPQGTFFEAGKQGERAALATVVRGHTAGTRMLVLADGARKGSLGAPSFDEQVAAAAGDLMWAERSRLLDLDDGTVFVDVVTPAPRLLLFGAVHVAAVLSALARQLGWRCWVIDPRGRFATPERFPDAEAVLALWPAAAVARVGGIDRATSVLALSHDPKLDDAALELALASPAAYVGAMGSRRATSDRAVRLTERGVAPHELARLAAPAGLDLGGRSAEETALSMLAELVAVRNGREGGRLLLSDGRIHAVEG